MCCAVPRGLADELLAQPSYAEASARIGAEIRAMPGPVEVLGSLVADDRGSRHIDRQIA